MNFPTSKASAAASPAAANEPAAKLGKPAGGSEFGARVSDDRRQDGEEGLDVLFRRAFVKGDAEVA